MIDTDIFLQPDSKEVELWATIEARSPAGLRACGTVMINIPHGSTPEVVAERLQLFVDKYKDHIALLRSQLPS